MSVKNSLFLNIISTDISKRLGGLDIAKFSNLANFKPGQERRMQHEYNIFTQRRPNDKIVKI